MEMRLNPLAQVGRLYEEAIQRSRKSVLQQPAITTTGRAKQHRRRCFSRTEQSELDAVAPLDLTAVSGDVTDETGGGVIDFDDVLGTDYETEQKDLQADPLRCGQAVACCDLATDDSRGGIDLGDQANWNLLDPFGGDPLQLPISTLCEPGAAEASLVTDGETSGNILRRGKKRSKAEDGLVEMRSNPLTQVGRLYEEAIQRSSKSVLLQPAPTTTAARLRAKQHERR